MADSRADFQCERCTATFETHQAKFRHKGREHPATREKLRADLVRVEQIVGKVPTQSEYDDHGDWSSTTVTKLFGSWADALQTVGLESQYRGRIPTASLIEELKCLATILGQTPTTAEMRSRGHSSVQAIQTRFGSWNAGLVAAGLDPVHRYSISVSELQTAIDVLVEELGRTPTADEMKQYGRFSHRPYIQRWGGWQAAVRAAGYEPVGRRSGRNHPNWNPDVDRDVTYYGSNWQEQRHRALSRDDFTCQSPNCTLTDGKHKEQYGAGIHVHHIEPISTFEVDGSIDYERASARSNLVTVCAEHHGQWEWVRPLRPDIGE